MIYQYLRFFVNGGVLGVAAWALQSLIYWGLGYNAAWAYALAAALTFIPLVMINFIIQRTWIFNRSGLFFRFVLSNLFIMALVSILSPLCRHQLNLVLGQPWGDRGGFVVAALLGSIPSFLIMKCWVFGTVPEES